ncbi:hypothetical protein [Acetobacter orleanensis]|uniref:Uncharacterized protein n=1 Tax=Acetobacter orleanensis TaxID=104099 RepID=A0A4Y3TI15_9PROT|nr:hypothetical protein [Acetobacter orleanensis]KXV63096.1 hypothetical protein AD949_07430 [Acetobacter orleanensis]PCD80278.1 hypothetical protein CO710_00465 [Acetobacter orleanensis]GAN68980.1 hypothetical protein Abol_024_119 [Acetobacter orleanensis JCM 7639]GEB81612.1 hypothetical protein AOR01nite_00890 [Acetobacter orleanensis]
MMRFPFMRCAFAFVGLSAGTLAVHSSAHAERVISDLEASKLTFASLTAAPPPVVHVHRVSHVMHVAHQTHGMSSHSMVHLVSYHAARHTVAHAATHRHRT